jgi:hypothetical protein
VATEQLPGTERPPPRRTILAPLPDEAPIPTAAPLPPEPSPAAPRRSNGGGAERATRPRGPASREEKPDSSTKAYLWRRNVRFIDSLVMNMEDHGARAGDINRSVVLRAAITALEKAGLGRDLARCTNEDELAALIVARLAGT